MKVIESLESIFFEQKALNDKLQKKVSDTIYLIKKVTWHYFDRVKQIESFALKLETGRFDPRQMEDFFACTLVVENITQIHNATSLIRKHFTIVDQKPKDLKFTHKEPYSFEFDDLRLYAKIRPSKHLPKEPLSEIIFEIQIKTFLQHAWAIATHDLIYKSDEVSWPKERVTYQIKAMLEQAEVAISGVDGIIGVAEVSKENSSIQFQKEILSFYKKNFALEELPKDLVRLCRNTKELLIALNLKVREISEILIAENKAGRGTNLKNLSPYLLLIQSVINQKKDIIENYINHTSKKFKIFLPKEVQSEKLLIAKKENIINLE